MEHNGPSNSTDINFYLNQMDNQTQNFIRESIAAADTILVIKDTVEKLLARYNLNGIAAKLDQEEMAGVPEFAHLTPAEVVGCVTAFQAFLTALGDEVSGQTTNLIKMKG